MNLRDIQAFYDYNCWATDRVLNAAGKLGAGQLTAPVSTSNYGSLRGTLVHTLDAEEAYRARMATGDNPPDLNEVDFPTVDSLAARWRAEQARMRTYIATLKDESLDEIAVYQSDGMQRQRPRWHIFAQLFGHGAQHRAEAAIILTSYNQSPGDLDFVVWADSLNKQ